MSIFDRFRKRRATAPAPESSTTVEDLGPDPLDPHGDGTIRLGDPMWEAMMSGQSIIANRRDDGEWDVQRLPGGESR